MKEQNYFLFLDDVRHPSHCISYMGHKMKGNNHYYTSKSWVIVRNYREFVEIIQKRGLPEFVSLDHDLAEAHYDPSTWKESFKYREETGYDCAKWLVNYCIDHKQQLPEFIVHSMNPVGAENIEKLLHNFKNNS